MKLNVLARIVVIFSLFLSTYSMALSEISPYQGLVPVRSLTESQLKEKALEQVFVKVSGNPGINKLNNSDILNNQIDSIISEFGYQVINNQNYYYAVFDKADIDSALSKLKQPVWAVDRPNILIWLLNENKQLTSDNMLDDSLVSGIKEGELTRGISTQFPLIDLDDSLAISVADVGGRFYKTVSEASKRYAADNYVTATLSRIADNEWELKWELVQYTASSKKSKVLIKQVTNGDKSAVMSSMIGDIADYYAEQFAVLETEGEKSTQTITIKNISSFQDVIQINSLLDNLNAVESFEVINISETEVELLISLKGGINSLINALNSHSKLQQNLITPSPFDYNWQP